MGIGDAMPSGGYRPKKPLTKAQIRKMQEAYKNADTITKEVREKEQKEQEEIAKNIDDALNIL